jgi:hypothetical protein
LRELTVSYGEATLAPCLIYGSIKSKYGSRTVHIVWDWQWLRGRIGGRLDGRRVDIEHQPPFPHGRVGGSLLGFDVRGTARKDAIEVRFSEEKDPKTTVRVSLAEGKAAGRTGGKRGQDIELDYDEYQVSGRIGRPPWQGSTIMLEHDAPAELAVLCAIIAHKVVDDQVALADGAVGAAIFGALGSLLYQIVF